MGKKTVILTKFLCQHIFQGNFFQNIGSITVFAVFGTLISAMIVGSGVYVLGLVMTTIYFPN